MKKLFAVLMGAILFAGSMLLFAGETRTVTLDVQNMTCAACPITVKKAINQVPGVVSATVDYESRTAVVTFDPSRASIEAITKATADAGYPSSVKR